MVYQMNKIPQTIFFSQKKRGRRDAEKIVETSCLLLVVQLRGLSKFIAFRNIYISPYFQYERDAAEDAIENVNIELKCIEME
jgi:hypothetical protein